jgi:hypothetical protein
MLNPDQSLPKCVEPHDKVPYQSPLRVLKQFESTVAYVDSITGVWVGMVYKHEGVWFLTAPLLNNGHPAPCRSKIDGFLLLNSLHQEQHE